MIPILYESDEVNFQSNGIGRLRDCISCKVTEERNGIYECDFEYPVSGANYKMIQPGRIIAAKHDYSGDVQPFDIVSSSRPINGIATFKAVHISYRQSGIVAMGTEVYGILQSFSMLKNNASPNNPFTYETDKEGYVRLPCADGLPHSVKSILGGMEGSLLDTFGGEYEFDKFKVKLYAARGQQRNLTIRYGVNLADYTEEIDYSETYSAVVPFWTGEDGNVVGSMMYHDVTTFDGRIRCVPLDLTDKFESKPTAVDLENTAWQMLPSMQPHLPHQNIKVDFIRLQDTEEYEEYANLFECGLCDTIRVVFPMYDMNGYFKIVRTVYNVLTERWDEVELGALKMTLAEALGISKSTR